MISKYKYTDKEMNYLLKSLVVLIDTREKENTHIKDYFRAKHISWMDYKLDYGDYSYMLPASPELGVTRDIYFTNDLSIERKASLDELPRTGSGLRMSF